MDINKGDVVDRDVQMAKLIRAACVQAGKEAYESASMSGLCSEGAWEAAIGAIEMLDIKNLIEQLPNVQ